MKSAVEEHVKSCPKCFAVNPNVSCDAPPLNPIPVPARIWSLVGIDIIGSLQESSQGNKYIVAITDHFSKWTEAAALPQKTAARVANFLYTTVCRLGCMDTLISDQGREFVNSVVDHLLERMSTEHRISSAYHPQTNGQRERDNRTLKEALAKQVNDECNNWDTLIPGVLLAYHASEHASTKISPFEVMYGRKARLPIDLNEGDVSNVEFQPEVMDSLQTQREAIKKKVSMNIHAAQSRQKAAYDKRHTSKDPPIGALVYIKNTRRIHQMGSKLEPRWTGPYRVVQLLGKGRIRLVHAASKRKLKNTYHMSNLKVFPSDGLSTDQKSSDIDHPASEEISEEEDCSVPSSGSPLTDAPQPGIF